MSKIISNLPNFDENKIAKIFQNCCDVISSEKPEKFEAELIVDAIKLEWKKRSLSGKSDRSRPNIGMLGFLGYKVGQEGETKKRRHFILKFVVNEQLPFVQSPMYVREWGEPKTKKRYLKTANVIKSFISKYTNYKQPGFEKALEEWKEDIEYLRTLYRDQFNKK